MPPQQPQAQSDPWEEAAKQFKGAAPQQGGQPQSAPAPNEDWKVWQTGGQAETADPTLMDSIRMGQGAFDKATTPTPYSADRGILSNIGSGLGNIGRGVLSLATPAIHPVQSLGAAEFANPAHPLQGLKGPDPLTQMGKSIYEHPMESAEMLAGQLLGGSLASRSVNTLQSMTDPLKEYRSPLIPQDEAVARAATDALKVSPADYRGTMATIREHMPSITAEAPEGKFKNPLEFAKAATQAGQKNSDFFRNELVEPNRNYAQVGPSYDELQTINDKLRAIYRSRTMGEQMTKESQDNMAALEQKRDALNDYLYRELSARSGQPEENIRQINQRGGALQHVGDVSDAAQATRRAGFAGYTPTGLPIPMSGVDRAMRLVSYLRGGPEASAGRKLTRVGGMAEGTPEPLPNPEEIRNYRRLSDQDELNVLRGKMADAEQNRANSRMRNLTREPAPPVVQKIQRLREGDK